MTPFGYRLEQARLADEDRFPSMASLARALGVSPQVYGAWLYGQGEPNMRMLGQIRRLLRIDLNYLVGGDMSRLVDQPPPPPPQKKRAGSK